MKNPTMKQLIANPNISTQLISATIKQMGGYAELKEHASDIVKYGANNGTSGFTWYTETVEFTKKNKKYILELAINQAQDCGYNGAYDMVRSFGLLRNKREPIYTEIEIYQAIHERNNENTAAVYDALAKYILEYVARAYMGLIEQD